MIRVLSLALVMLAVAPCLGQAKKKQADPPKPIARSVGDRLTLTAPIVVAVEEFDSLELAKSIQAGDKEGITAMVDSGKAKRLPAGLQIVVLEINTVDRRREDKSNICRVIQDGKAVGRYAIHFSWFTTATMRMDKNVDDIP